MLLVTQPLRKLSVVYGAQGTLLCPQETATSHLQFPRSKFLVQELARNPSVCNYCNSRSFCELKRELIPKFHPPAINIMSILCFWIHLRAPSELLCFMIPYLEGYATYALLSTTQYNLSERKIAQNSRP
jgi:hypothetical protein